MAKWRSQGGYSPRPDIRAFPFPLSPFPPFPLPSLFPLPFPLDGLGSQDNYLLAQGTFAISNHVTAKHGQVTTVGAGWFTGSFGQPGRRVLVNGQTERSEAQRGGERTLLHPRPWKASSNNRSTPKKPLSSTPNFSASRVRLDMNRKGSPASEALGCTTEENRTLCQRAERGW